MAVDLSGDFISGIWHMLYDDNYIPDNRSIENGAVFVSDPSMLILCSVYFEFTGNYGSKRNLFLAAGSRHFNDNRVYCFD